MDDLQILSEQQIQRLCQDVGMEVMPELLESFKNDVQQYLVLLREMTVTPEDADIAEKLQQIAFAGHALKGISHSFGFDALAGVGDHLQMRSRQVPVDGKQALNQFCLDFSVLQPQLDVLYRESLKALNEWFSEKA